MRTSLLVTAALAGLVLSPAAFAQGGTPATQSPPSPNAGGPEVTATPAMPGMTGMRPMRTPGHHPAVAARQHRRPARTVDQGQAGVAGEDAGLRPGQQVGTGGATSPTSTQASNINGGTSRGEIAPRLPDPDAGASTPDAYLAAANRALQRNQTGAAQEALERAETRLLDRSTDPAMAGTPSNDPRAVQVSQARQALARRDIAGARRAIQAAMGAPEPMSQPMGQPMRGQPAMQPGMSR